MGSTPTAPADPRLHAGRATRSKVLVVDDDPNVRGVLSVLLEALGFEVGACADGDQAWALLEDETWDMLITDWMLPGTLGPDLIRRIRLSERFPGLYVILVTGRADCADRVEGLEAGADDFLAKPFDDAELRVRVRTGQRIIALQQRLREQNRLLRSRNVVMTRELQAAGAVQRALIPARPPATPGFDWAWAFHPHSQASGDMFGVFPLDERHVGAFLVDVSGHGMAAAMLSFTVSRLMMPVPGHDSLVKRRLDRPPFYEIVAPEQVLQSLRDWFQRDETSGFFFTLIYAVLNADSGDLRWVSAGHYPPILWQGGAWHSPRAQLAQTPIGMPIATRGDAGPNHASLAPGDRIFFYSDGLIDLRHRDGYWLGEDALGEAIAATSQLPIGACVDEVIGRMKESAVGRSFDDDVTLVGLERRRSP